MTSPRKLRVALGPIEIAGYYASLAAGLEQLGAECALLMVAPHAFRYATRPPAGRVARFALERAQASHPGRRSRRARLKSSPVHWISRAALVAHALRSYDVFIFSSGQTWLKGAELPLLKLAGKKIVFIFHGSDSRPPYINGKSVRRAGTTDPGSALARRAGQMKRRLAWVQRYADAIIDNPLSGHFHDEPFINWFRIGIPYAAADGGVAADRDGARGPGQPLRVVHAPSDPASKGSPLIERAVERARGRGIAIDFVQVKGRPNAEVLDELSRCDFVIDELYSDVPGAGLAFEAASFGRPTIVAGYAASEFQRWIEPEMALPTHYCRPDDLDVAIDKLALDASYREALGARALRFVREQSAPVAVARRIMRVLARDHSSDWFVDPSQISYLHGTGLPEETAREAVRTVIEAAGEQGLQLSSKPDLVARLKAFAFDQPQRS